MKRISGQLVHKYSCAFLSLIILSSCSWVSSRKSLFGNDTDEAPSSIQKTVPKAQYDELAHKYEGLLKQRRLEKADSSQANQMLNEMEKSDPPISRAHNDQKVIDQLGKVKSATRLAETVDVFSERKRTRPSMGSTSAVVLGTSGGVSESIIEDHIKRIRQAESLVAQNKSDAAMAIIKDLEKSPVRQVVVRAKFLLGEVLFKQEEYDLSMQIFEEVLQKHAFSGLVIKSLGRLIVCSDKLKIADKQEKYYSILHDFFEQGES